MTRPHAAVVCGSRVAPLTCAGPVDGCAQTPARCGIDADVRRCEIFEFEGGGGGEHDPLTSLPATVRVNNRVAAHCGNGAAMLQPIISHNLYPVLSSASEFATS